MFVDEMYIDETIEIDFSKLPVPFREYLETMEKAKAVNDFLTWDSYHETVGEYAKNLCSQNSISKEVRDKIWLRYRTAG